MAVSKRLRYEVFRRDGHTCVYCGRSAPDVKLQPDHVVPEALGGRTQPANLVTACEDCNSGKSATPPDAAVVEGVSESAIRWAGAMRAAADAALADLNALEETREEFREKWNSWKAAGETMPLPSNWADSVDRFLAAGLPMPILLDCVDRAMSKPRIKADDLFRYMCGIAWSRVTELQEAAQSLADSPDAALDAPKGSSVKVGRLHFARELLADHADEGERERFIADARTIFVESSDAAPDEAEIVIDAAYTMVGTLAWSKSLLNAAIKDLLSLLPSDDVARCREAAEREAQRQLGEEPPEPELLLLTLTRWLRYLRFFRTLPIDEQREWAERLAASRGRATDDVPEVDVAAYVGQGQEADSYHLPGMCVRGGVHGAMCPHESTYLVFIDACERCAQQMERPDCAGHPMCETHAAEMVDGFRDPGTGQPVQIRDVTELVTV